MTLLEQAVAAASTETSAAQGRVLAAALSGLADLVEKYALLEQLRRADPGRSIDRRDAMRVVAARFPGALREWDVLTLVRIVERRREAEALLRLLVEQGASALPLLGSPERAWMRYALAIHERLRVALAARVGSSRGRLGSKGPRGARLSQCIYAEVAAEAGVSVETLKEALFGAPTAAPSGAITRSTEEGR